VKKAALALAILTLPSCGGGAKSTTPTPTPTALPGTNRSVLTHGTRAIRAPDSQFTYFTLIDFTTPISGRLEVSVDWTYPTSDVWIFVSSAVCTAEQFQACPGVRCTCPFLASSQTPTPKPQLFTVASVPPGSRSLFVWNRGPHDESIVYDVSIYQ